MIQTYIIKVRYILFYFMFLQHDWCGMVYNYLLLFDGWVAVKLICYPFFIYMFLFNAIISPPFPCQNVFIITTTSLEPYNNKMLFSVSICNFIINPLRFIFQLNLYYDFFYLTINLIDIKISHNKMGYCEILRFTKS
jgi:hypothetical protein